MERHGLNYRRILIIGFTGVALLVVVAWGLQQSLSPQETQRVRASSAASPFDGQRAMGDLEKIVAIGPRVAGTENSRSAKAIIVAALEKAGIDVVEYPFEATTPIGKRDMINIVGIVEGTTDGIIILGNHYDTKHLPDIDFVGANDGGSTTAWMMEMARALGPNRQGPNRQGSNRQGPKRQGSKRQGHSVWLCFWDGEEAFEDWTETDSLYGSRWMASRLQDEGQVKNIKALINVDMIGDCYLGIIKDPGAPPWLVDTIWDTAETHGYAQHFLSLRQAIEDDHLPFRRVGIPAINLIDFRYGGSSLDHRRNWHTANDTLDRVCADSLQAVGDVVYHAILALDTR